MTVKNAYLLITDMHRCDNVKKNRFSYRKEIIYVDKIVLNLLKKYLADGYNTNIIFLGDIFDAGYKNITTVVEDTLLLSTYCSYCDKVYSLIGNHELTYYSGNLFYMLFHEIKSEKVKKIQNQVWSPKGYFQIINVVDKLTDGDTVFHFNHFGTEVSPIEEGKINIGLFHQNLICQEIMSDMKMLHDQEIYGGKTINLEKSVIGEYDYCFFGHMHKVYGTWIIDTGMHKTTLEYLASLGRPNYTEVMDSFLERDIPVVIVKDGMFSGIDHNRLSLMSYKECVKEEIVSENTEKYSVIKERAKARAEDSLIDDPVKDLLMKLDDNKRDIIISLINGKDPKIELQIMQKLFDLNRGGGAPL